MTFTFNYKSWPFWVILIAVALLAFAMFRSCDHTATHKADKMAVDSIFTSVSIKEHALQVQLKYFQGRTEVLRKENDSLKTEKKKLIAAAAQKLSRLTVLPAQYRSAAAKKDTLAMVQNCDSVMSELANAKELNDAFLKVIQDTDVNYEAQLTVKDSIINAQAAAYSDLRGSFNVVTAKFNDVYTDYDKLRKKHRRGRTVTRIAAAIALTAGALLIIK